MHPNHWKLLKQAQALGSSGKPLEAAATYREFLHREPKHADAWADYAGQRLLLGDLEEAQKACDAALAIAPDQVSARINLGCILLRRNRLAEAEGHFRSVVRVNSHRMDAQLFLAECLLKKRDLEGARKVLAGAIQPGVMDVRYAVLQARQAELWGLFRLALLEEQRFGEASFLRYSLCSERH